MYYPEENYKMLPVPRQLTPQTCSSNMQVLIVHQPVSTVRSQLLAAFCLFASARGKARGPGCTKVSPSDGGPQAFVLVDVQRSLSKCGKTATVDQNLP